MPELDILTPQAAAVAYPTKTAVASTARSVVPAAGIAFLHDSIGGFNSATGQAWHRIACPLSMGRLQWRGGFGSSGFTLAQIRDTHLSQVLALNPRPGAVAICGGTNDTGSSAYDEAASRAVLLDIIDKLIAAGITPVLWTLPPRDDSAAVNILVQRWNVWVRGLAGARHFPLIDAHSVLVDPATGLYRSEYKQDDVHPGRVGHFALGKAIGTDARFLAHFPTNGVYLSASKGADPSMIAPAARFFDAGTNGNGVPANWGGVGLPTEATGSIVAGDSTIRGSWYRFSKTVASTAAQAFIRAEVLPGASTYQTGDRVAWVVRFRANAQEDGSGASAYIALTGLTASAVVASTTVYSAGGENLDGIAYMELPITDTMVKLRAEVGIVGKPTVDSWIQYAQPTLINLTKLGL
jgi:hypothetical protein